MIQFKEKSKGQESCNVGIFNYPILMAADILLYDATYVPIGEDQFQHIELTRNLAVRFNRKYGEIFVVPVKTSEQVQFMGTSEGVRIRDLLNPENKMSKSTPAENSKIMMNDTPERAGKKIMSATTDSLGRVKYDMHAQPGISNLITIEALVNDLPIEEVAKNWTGETRYGEFKKKVAESVSGMLSDFQTKLQDITDEQILKLLESGEKYANEVANAKLLEVQKAVGLR